MSSWWRPHLNKDNFVRASGSSWEHLCLLSSTHNMCCTCFIYTERVMHVFYLLIICTSRVLFTHNIYITCFLPVECVGVSCDGGCQDMDGGSRCACREGADHVTCAETGQSTPPPPWNTHTQHTHSTPTHMPASRWASVTNNMTSSPYFLSLTLTPVLGNWTICGRRAWQ